MPEDAGYDQLLRLLGEANLDFDKLASWLLEPENRPAYDAIPRLKRTTRMALGSHLDAAIERRRMAGLPLPGDRDDSPWKEVVYHVRINKVSIYSVLIRHLRQLFLSSATMKGLLVALEASAGIHHCDAAEDMIAVTLTGYLSMGDAVDLVTGVLRSYLGKCGYIVEVDVE